MEPEGSQGPFCDPHPVPDKYSTYHYILFL